MLISAVSNKSQKVQNYRGVVFQGQLEDEYFSAGKNKSYNLQLQKISNSNFDIFETDYETGDNFLHSAFKSNHKSVISRAVIMLTQKTTRDLDLAKVLLEERNKESKTPLEYANSYAFQMLQSLFKKLQEASYPINVQQPPVENSEPVVKPQNTQNDMAQRKLNELPKGTKLVIPKFEDDDDEDIPISRTAKQSEVISKDITSQSVMQNENIIEKYIPEDRDIKIQDVAGLTEAKEIITKRIINPINAGKPVTDSGFLIYGLTGSGKSFLLNAIANTLERDVINNTNFFQLIEEAVDVQDENDQLQANSNNPENSETSKKAPEDKEKELAKLKDKRVGDVIDKNIVRVENVQELESVIDFARVNYNRTNKQTMIYIDEIKGILPDVTAINSDKITKAEQLIENSAQKGFILIATTREKDSLSPASIRERRFDKKIEIKFPNKSERKEMIEKYLIDTSFSKEELESMVNRTSGFSYLNMRKVIEELNELEAKDFDSKIEVLKQYARKNNLGELQESGTTANYDTKYKREKVKINFSNVAGMDHVKSQFQTLVINRLKPEALKRFKANGNRTPLNGGFLLYGPPGTGKTFIAEALAGEMNLPLYKLDASKFESKYVGESTKNIAAIFNQLATKFRETGEYSILFIDEADSILSNREKAGESKSDVVNELLKHLNKPAENGIIVLTATNYKDKIDAAMLSRLGFPIQIDLPDVEARKAMVKLAIKGVLVAQNLTEDDIAEIASRLGGFSARDISIVLETTINNRIALSDTPLTVVDFEEEINNFALSHELPEINDRNKTSAYDTYLKRVQIDEHDPKSLDELGGIDDFKKQLLRAATSDTEPPEILERLKRNRIKDRGGILLYGEPGTGKTYLLKALAAHLNLPLYELKLGDQGSSLIHQTSRNIGNIFAQLKTKYKKTGEKSILLMDEFEDIAGKRGRASEYKQEETDTLLKEINDARKNGIIVVAATNYYEKIDEAIKRPGRFTSIRIPIANEEQRFEMLKKFFRDKDAADEIRYNDEYLRELAKVSEGLTIAAITTALDAFMEDAIRGRVEVIKFEDFKQALINKKIEMENSPQ